MQTVLVLFVSFIALILGCSIFYLGIRVGLSIQVKGISLQKTTTKNDTQVTNKKAKKAVYFTPEHEEKIIEKQENKEIIVNEDW